MLYDEVKNELNYNLEYEFINKIKEIFYADFESDVSQDIHQQYIVCVQSRLGLKEKTFIGEDCAKDFLNYIIQFISFLP